MKIGRWALLGVLLVGAIVGAGTIVASVSVYHHSDASDAFCAQCHTMAQQGSDIYFQRSRHVSNPQGVRPTCGNCHIPTTNWFVNTFTRISFGVKDSYAQLTHDFSNPAAWEAHRVEIQAASQATFRANDGVTCRSCHNVSAIKPTSEEGRNSHALLAQGGVTCIDCHTNLVHPPAGPVVGQTLPSNRSR
jgi:nitrate/TMAO reductase-like tetraheme cytochrome c subunit